MSPTQLALIKKVADVVSMSKSKEAVVLYALQQRLLSKLQSKL